MSTKKTIILRYQQQANELELPAFTSEASIAMYLKTCIIMCKWFTQEELEFVRFVKKDGNEVNWKG